MSSAAVVAYQDLCETLAWPFVGRAGAEYDDLVQEGLISVWQALQVGRLPSKDIIQKDMLAWVRFCRHLNPPQFAG